MERRKIENLVCFGYLVFVSCISIGFLVRTTIEAVCGVLFFRPTGTGYTFIDYVAFYSCGKIVLSDQRAHIYDPLIQLQFYNNTLAHFKVDHVPLGQSVPWFFLFMSPFSLLPLMSSFICYTVIGITLSVLGLIALLRQSQCTKQFIALFLIGVFGCHAAQWLIHDGQNSWFLLAATCLFLHSWFGKRDFLGGVALAILSIKPQYALFLAVPALACRRWGIILGAALNELALVALSSTVFGANIIRDYLPALKNIEQTSVTVFPTWMVSIRGPLSTLIGIDTALTVTYVVYGLSLVLLFIFWLRISSSLSEQKARLAFAATILLALLTSPHTHIYDLVIFSAAAALITPSLNWFQASQFGSEWVLWCRTLILYPLFGFAFFVLTTFIQKGEIIGFSYFVFDCWLFYLLAKCIKAEVMESRVDKSTA